MIEYKINVLEELKKIGFNSTTAKETGILSQSAMKKIKEKNTNISLDTLNRICCLLEMQPRDIIKFVETDQDKKNIINKLKK